MNVTYFFVLSQIHAVRLREDGVHVLRTSQVAAQEVQQDAPRPVSDFMKALETLHDLQGDRAPHGLCFLDLKVGGYAYPTTQ